jgi:hypothetical protein
VGGLIPAGWYYQNELHVDRAAEVFCLPVVDTDREILSPTSVDCADAAVDADIQHVGPYNILERGIGGLHADAMTVAYGQNAANLARIAIALERYRLARGEYPDFLTPLETQFITRLPHDIIDGQRLHYRRTANGQFLLYSIGWNETDDGGNVVMDSTGSPVRAVWKWGDWVWRYPEKIRQFPVPKTSFK